MKDLNEMSLAELEVLLEKKRNAERESRIKQRAAYEELRSKTVCEIRSKVLEVTEGVRSLFDFVRKETEAFKSVMADYGQLRFDNQQSFTIQDGDFRVVVKSNKVKKFDERADMAAIRLIDFLNDWMRKREKGADDAMYQLAMTLLERNKMGELDYKSINKLYEMEEKFNNPEYSAIMQLFKESSVVNGTAINYYFYRKSDRGVWLKVEPSFNML